MSSPKLPAWHNILNDFIENPHILGHMFGFNDLNETHSKWVRLFLDVPRAGETVLQAHRNSYKTTSGLVAMAIMALIYPNIRVLIVRKTIKNAEALISALKRIFESEIMRLICKARYNLDSFESAIWSGSRLLLSCKTSITPEVSFEPAGIGTAQTGRHYDYIWCDDIVTIDDRLSPASSESTKSYVQELSNIVTLSGSRMYTGTPWHDEDAFSILPKPHKYPIGTINIPEITPAWIEAKKRQMTNSLWSINYELEHTEDTDRIGPFIQTDKFHTEYLVAWIDGSYSDRMKSDRTAVSIVGFIPNPLTKSDLWDIEFIGKSWQKSITDPTVMRELIEFLNIYQPIETCLESQLGDSTKIFIDKLISTEKEMNMSPLNLWTWQHQTKNKHHKIQFFVAGNKSRIKVLENCDKEFLLSIVKYAKNAKNDDEADALADGINLWQTSKYLVSYIRAFEQMKNR